MKTFALLLLFSTTAQAYECRIMAHVDSQDKMETSFNTASYQECQNLAQRAEKNNFFGLVDGQEEEVRTSFLYNEAVEEERY